MYNKGAISPLLFLWRRRGGAISANRDRDRKVIDGEWSRSPPFRCCHYIQVALGSGASTDDGGPFFDREKSAVDDDTTIVSRSETAITYVALSSASSSSWNSGHNTSRLPAAAAPPSSVTA